MGDLRPAGSGTARLGVGGSLLRGQWGGSRLGQVVLARSEGISFAGRGRVS
ncbi:hypothetical protein FCV25MIE_22542, partial [Fagus crenata]